MTGLKLGFRTQNAKSWLSVNVKTLAPQFLGGKCVVCYLPNTTLVIVPGSVANPKWEIYPPTKSHLLPTPGSRINLAKLPSLINTNLNCICVLFDLYFIQSEPDMYDVDMTPVNYYKSDLTIHSLASDHSINHRSTILAKL